MSLESIWQYLICCSSISDMIQARSSNCLNNGKFESSELFSIFLTTLRSNNLLQRGIYLAFSVFLLNLTSPRLCLLHLEHRPYCLSFPRISCVQLPNMFLKKIYKKDNKKLCLDYGLLVVSQTLSVLLSLSLIN